MEKISRSNKGRDTEYHSKEGKTGPSMKGHSPLVC